MMEDSLHPSVSPLGAIIIGKLREENTMEAFIINNILSWKSYTCYKIEMIIQVLVHKRKPE